MSLLFLTDNHNYEVFIEIMFSLQSVLLSHNQIPDYCASLICLFAMGVAEEELKGVG